MKVVPDPTVKRLIQYYRYLNELESKDEEQVISSVMFGKGIGGGSQVKLEKIYLPILAVYFLD